MSEPRNEPIVIEALLPLFKYDIKNLSQKETTEIRDLFNLFDIDGNGSINKKEFRIVMNSLGYNITDGKGYFCRAEISVASVIGHNFRQHFVR